MLSLWNRRVATAPIGPLAWELPYAVGSGPRKGKKTKKKVIIITLNVNGLNEPIKRHRVADWIKKKNLQSAVYKNLP